MPHPNCTCRLCGIIHRDRDGIGLPMIERLFAADGREVNPLDQIADPRERHEHYIRMGTHDAHYGSSYCPHCTANDHDLCDCGKGHSAHPTGLHYMHEGA